MLDDRRQSGMGHAQVTDLSHFEPPNLVMLSRITIHRVAVPVTDDVDR